MPTILVNLCSLTDYNQLFVQRAIDFIGIEKPKDFSLSFKKREKEKKPWAITLSVTTSHSSANYWFYLNGITADSHGGNLECLSHSGGQDIYPALLWVFLNPLKEMLKEIK